MHLTNSFVWLTNTEVYYWILEYFKGIFSYINHIYILDSQEERRHNIHKLKTRAVEKYKVQHANTERLKKTQA